MNLSADEINLLPTDNTIPSYAEMKIVNDIFKNNKKDVRKIFHTLRDTILVFILFFVFSLSFVDGFIGRWITDSNMLLVVKAIIVAIIYFFASNFYLAKTK